MKPSAVLGKTKGGGPISYLGRTALTREQCNGFSQSVSRQRLDKYFQRTTMEDVSQWKNVIARC
jgi:hypothetical protein